MAAAETTVSGPRLRALGLLGVLVIAKVVLIASLGLRVSGWSAWAWLWQDVLVALAFWTIDRAIDRAWAGWTMYAAFTAYVAVNVPIALVLSSPLTPTMMRAAGRALDDSIAAGATKTNIASLVTVAAVAIALPLLIKRRPLLHGRAMFVAACVIVAGGPWASAHVDTHGCDRNAVTALLWRRMPAAHAEAAKVDLRASPLAETDEARVPVTDLSRFRGAARRSNVLVIVLESAGAQYLKPYGAASDPMPNVTALASRSIVFDNAYAVYPESIKSLFTTLCSRYAAFDVSVEAHAEAPCASVASQFGAAGYRTALFHSGRFGYLGMDAMLARKGFDVLEDAGAIGGQVHSSFGIDERSTVRRALSWIDTLKADQPFFATYLPVAGHHPYLTNEQGPFPPDTEINRYRNALHESDAAIGDLLEGLRHRGLDRNTAIVVVGDHGEAFGQHAGNAGHTLYIYDENVHVPLVVSVPGFTTSMRSSAIVSAIDLAPTMLDFAGLTAPAEYDGVSMLQPGKRMALFFTDYSLGFLGLRDGCWKDTLAVDSGRSTLFNVCRDPGETMDLSAGQAQRVRAYQERLESWSSMERRSLQSENHSGSNFAGDTSLQ